MVIYKTQAIEKQFGVRLPMAQLFSAPSVAALAVSITSNAVSDQLAVPMQIKGNLPPLFLIHPGGGGVFLGGGNSQGFYKGYYLNSNIRYEPAEKYNKSGEWIPYRGGVMISYKL